MVESLAKRRAMSGLCPQCGEEAAPCRLCAKHRQIVMISRLLDRAHKLGGVKKEKIKGRVHYSMGDESAWKRLPKNPIGIELRPDDKRLLPRVGGVPVNVGIEIVGILHRIGRPASEAEIISAWGRLRETRKAGTIGGNVAAIVKADQRRSEKNARRARLAIQMALPHAGA